MAGERDWEQCYVTDNLPWDTTEPSPPLVALVEERGLRGRALDIGCGTGTHSAWLARHGFEVLAIDIAPTAVKRTTERCAGLPVEARVADIRVEAPAPDGSMDLVFDRGALHCMDGDERAVFAERVARALRPDGLWLSLVGNADEITGEGPPRWTAGEVVRAIEPRFIIEELSALRHAGRHVERRFWKVVSRPRSSLRAG